MPQTAPKTDTSTFREIRSAHEAGASSVNDGGGVGVSGDRKTGASFARGASKQDYATPIDFLRQVQTLFGRIDFDLAATHANSVCGKFFGPPGTERTCADVTAECMAVDSLAQDWTALVGNLWLNPPFDRIAPWAKKCAASRFFKGRILFLVPAAVGSNWFRDYVDNVAQVSFLNGRLSFDGKNPYPKDCLLAVYSAAQPNYEVWNWREPIPQATRYIPINYQVPEHRDR